MELIKIIPPWLCQTIFVDVDKDENEKLVKMNPNDLNIFYLLIFITSKEYHKTKLLTQRYSFNDIKTHLNAGINTNSLKEILIKLDNIIIHSNLLQSYDDKKIQTFMPFQIKIQKDTNNKSSGLEIIIDEEFIKSFEKPSPIFVLNYDYFTSLKSTQSKLLYLFLADAVGIYKTKTRNVEVDILKVLLNRGIDYDIDEFKKDLKGAKNKISETDIEIKYEEIKDFIKDKDGSMNNELIGFKFDVTRIKNKPWYKKETKKDEVYVNEILEPMEDELSENGNDNIKEENTPFSIHKLIESIIDTEVEAYEKTSKIHSMGGFRTKIKKEFPSNQQTYLKKIYMWLEKEKRKIESSDDINSTKANVVMIFDHKSHVSLIINYKYLLCDHTGKEKKSNHKDTWKFLNNLSSNHEITITDNPKSFCKVSRLNIGIFFD